MHDCNSIGNIDTDLLLGTKLEVVGPKMSVPLMKSALISVALESGCGHVG